MQTPPCPSRRAKRISADDHPGAHVYPARQLPDLPVVERNAAVGPVDRLLDVRVAAADTMDPQLTAERRVLRRGAMLPQGLDDGVVFCAADASFGIGAAGDARRGIIETVERAETAVPIDPGHMENAPRRGFVAAEMRIGNASAADCNVAETNQDVVFCGKNRQGKRPRIDENQGCASRAHDAAGPARTTANSTARDLMTCP